MKKEMLTGREQAVEISKSVSDGSLPDVSFLSCMALCVLIDSRSEKFNVTLLDCCLDRDSSARSAENRARIFSAIVPFVYVLSS